MSWLQRLPWRELIKYGIVGTAGVGLFTVMLPLVRSQLIPSAFWAGVSCSVVVALVNYNIKRIWAFESHTAHSVSAPRYALLVSANILADGVGTAWLIGTLGWPVWLAAVFMAVPKPLINFAVLYLWVFGRGHAAHMPGTGRST